jgi:hypothetical protein
MVMIFISLKRPISNLIHFPSSHLTPEADWFLNHIANESRPFWDGLSSSDWPIRLFGDGASLLFHDNSLFVFMIEKLFLCQLCVFHDIT